MLADNLDRIVAKLSKELVRALRESSRKELLALLPGLAKELAAKAPVAREKSGKRPGPKPKARRGRAPKESLSGAQRKRGAGSLTRQIMKLLEVRREGFRFEEIQRRFKADPVELRETLGVLLSSDRIVRHGQARGTRYSLPLGDGPDSLGGGDFSLSASGLPKDAPEPPAPIEVTDSMIDSVRLLLVETSSPTSIQEFQATLPFTREQLKAILEQMKQNGLIERVGKGPSPRYQLTSHSSKKGPSEAPRVVRKRSGEDASAKEHEETAPAAPEPAAPSDPAV